MATFKITGLTPGATFHIHAAELDAEATVDKAGAVVFEVDRDFHAMMPQAVTWDDTHEGGVVLGRLIRAGDVIEVI